MLLSCNAFNAAHGIANSPTLTRKKPLKNKTEKSKAEIWGYWIPKYFFLIMISFFVLIDTRFWPLLKGQQLLTTVNALTFLLVTDIALSLPIISFQHASVCVSVASLEQLK